MRVRYTLRTIVISTTLVAIVVALECRREIRVVDGACWSMHGLDTKTVRYAEFRIHESLLRQGFVECSPPIWASERRGPPTWYRSPGKPVYVFARCRDDSIVVGCTARLVVIRGSAKTEVELDQDLVRIGRLLRKLNRELIGHAAGNRSLINSHTTTDVDSETDAGARGDETGSAQPPGRR